MRFSKTLLVAAAAGLLSVTTVACTSSPTSESTGQYVDSSVISNKVRAEIVRDKQLSIFDIDVTTHKNVVQLSGFVNTPEQRQRAEQIAENVAGVADVRNNIEVKPR